MPSESLVPETEAEIAQNKLEFALEGMIIEVDINSGELIRIISSNPGNYLLYQPGNKINFIPQFQ